MRSGRSTKWKVVEVLLKVAEDERKIAEVQIQIQSCDGNIKFVDSSMIAKELKEATVIVRTITGLGIKGRLQSR